MIYLKLEDCRAARRTMNRSAYSTAGGRTRARMYKNAKIHTKDLHNRQPSTRRNTTHTSQKEVFVIENRDTQNTTRTVHIRILVLCTTRQTPRGPIQSPRRLQSPLRSPLRSPRVAFRGLLLLEGDGSQSCNLNSRLIARSVMVMNMMVFIGLALSPSLRALPHRTTHHPKPSLNALTATTPDPAMIRLGDKWWLNDKDESQRPPPVGLRKYFAIVGAVAFVCIASVLYSTRSGVFQWNTTPLQVATSHVLSPIALLIWRTAAAVSTSALTLIRVSRSSMGVLEDLDRRGRTFRYSGVWRFQGLTGWSWLLINSYFVLALGLTLAPAGASNSVALLLASNACQVLLGATFAFALLVSSVVTFVLIPNRHAKGLSVAEYFRVQVRSFLHVVATRHPLTACSVLPRRRRCACTMQTLP